MTLSYQVFRSKRKTIAIQIKENGDVVVRCPNQMKTEDIQRFVDSKRTWIETHRNKLAQFSRLPVFTPEELIQMKKQALVQLSQRAEYFAPLVGVSYGRITVRAQKTRWGSCSSRGNLNFNCLLALVPQEVLDYVVVHELCHRKEMNHSRRFWKEVEAILPDYQMAQRWLKEQGRELFARLPEKSP